MYFVGKQPKKNQPSWWVWNQGGKSSNVKYQQEMVRDASGLNTFPGFIIIKGQSG